MSSIVLPQLEQKSETELSITSEEGSWFGKHFHSYILVFKHEIFFVISFDDVKLVSLFIFQQAFL